jgi:hypothetical protein
LHFFFVIGSTNEQQPLSRSKTNRLVTAGTAKTFKNTNPAQPQKDCENGHSDLRLNRIFE